MNTFPYIKHSPPMARFSLALIPTTKTWRRFQTHTAAEAWLKERSAVPCVADEDGNYTFTLPVHSSQIVALASSISRIQSGSRRAVQ